MTAVYSPNETLLLLRCTTSWVQQLGLLGQAALVMAQVEAEPGGAMH